MSLTVIIPNYNNQKFLSRCIESVLNQSLVPDEIIVVDDCSTDLSVDIIRDFEKKRSIVKGIYLNKNGGVSHARNTGISIATTDYITTLDADDFYFNKDKLKNEMFLLNGRSDAFAYSKLVFVNEQDEIIRYVDYPKKHYLQGMIYKKLIAGKSDNTVPRDYCFPRRVLENSGGYDESNSLFEDYDLLIRISKYLKACCTFEYGTAYRIKSFGLSQRPQKVLQDAKMRVQKKNIDDISLPSKIVIYATWSVKWAKRKFGKMIKMIKKNER